MHADCRRAVMAAVLVALGVVGVAAQTPKAVPAYDVSFVTGPAGEEATYTGTTTFQVDATGTVSGTMTIVDPATVRAKLAGKMDKGTWTFEYAYDIPDQGCTGRLTGTAKVPDDRKVITGTAVVSGECSPEPMNATFTFTLREIKK
jgi:hypothetical protein